MTSILEEADKLINGDRKEDYGDVRESFERIAKLWSVVLGIEVTSKQVNLCMMQLKMSREIGKHKRDNLVDICGYAALVDKLLDNNE